jgi:hypothetical protein
MADERTTADDLQARVIAKAWEDDEFKQTLLDDPRSAIAEELGVELPDDLEIQVVEETPNKICLVLPIRPGALAESELMDEDLEAVSGGVLTPTRGAENLRYMKITDPVGGFGKLAAITRTMPGFRNR